MSCQVQSAQKRKRQDAAEIEVLQRKASQVNSVKAARTKAKEHRTHPRCTMIDDMPLPSPIAYVLCDSHVRYVCTCVHASICTSDCTRWHDHVWRATSSCGGSQRTFCMCMPHGTRGLLLSLVALSEQCFEVLMRNAQLCVHPPNTHCGFIS